MTRIPRSAQKLRTSAVAKCRMFRVQRMSACHPPPCIGQDRRRIGQDNRPVDHRLNQICRIGQILRKTRRFDGSNPVSRLYPRIEQDALDLLRMNRDRTKVWAPRMMSSSRNAGPRGLVAARTRMLESRVNLTRAGRGFSANAPSTRASVSSSETSGPREPISRA